MSRFREDYRLVKEVGSDGKIHSEMKYIGNYNYFVENGSIVKASGKKLFAAVVLAWAAYLAPLMIHNTSQSYALTAFTYIMLAFPLWFLSKAVLLLLRGKSKLENKEAALLDEYYKIASVCLIVFPIITGVGFVIGFVRKRLEFGTGELLHIICTLLLIVIGLFIRSLAEHFRTRERMGNALEAINLYSSK